jgi:hypothetical protein
MTAEYLVGEIFSRHREMPSDKRILTAREFVALRALILNEESKGTVHAGLGGSLVWMAPGEVKYVLTEDRVSWKHTLTRMSTATTAQSEMLF